MPESFRTRSMGNFRWRSLAAPRVAAPQAAALGMTFKVRMTMFLLALLVSGCAGKPPRDPNRTYIDEVKHLQKGELTHVGIFTTRPIQNYAVTKTDDERAILITAEGVDASEIRFPKRFKSKVISSFSAKNTVTEMKSYGQLFVNLKQGADFTAKPTEYGLRVDIRPIPTEGPPATAEAKEAPPEEVERGLEEIERTEEKEGVALEEDLKEVGKEPEAEIPETQAEVPALEPVAEKKKEYGVIEKISRSSTEDKEKLTLISSVPLSFEKNILDREVILEFKETEAGPELAPSEIDEPESFLSKITPSTTDTPYKSAKVSIQFNDSVSPLIEQEANEIYIEFEKKRPPKFLEAAEEAVIDFGHYLTSPTRLQGKELSLHAKDTAIEDILQMLSEASDYNLVLGKGISAKVNLRLLRVPWDEALIAILEAHQLGFVKQGNILRIAGLDHLRKEKEKARAALLAKDRLTPLKILFLPLRHRNASELKPHLYPLLSERGSISIDRSSNTIIMSDIPSVLEQAKSFVASLDTKK